MLRGFLTQKFLTALLVVLMGIVLYGRTGGLPLATFLVAFAAWRIVVLAREAVRKPLTVEQLDALRHSFFEEFERLGREELDEEAQAMDLPPGRSPGDLADAHMVRILRENPPPRVRREIVSEALGVAAFVLLLPASAAMLHNDFFSARRPVDWEGCLVAGIGIALYLAPRFWFRRSPNLRMAWWGLPFAPALALVIFAVHTRHPYLDPFRPDRQRLAADQVIAINHSGHSIIAGSHSDWVLGYARRLDREERAQEAMYYYREGLRLDPNDREAARRLMALEGRPLQPEPETASKSPFEPLWEIGHPFPSTLSCSIDDSLAALNEWAIVIVPVGDVPPSLVDATAFAIRRELGLTVFAGPRLALPKSTRFSGLSIGRQWSVDSIAESLQTRVELLPAAPVKYLFLTPVDIYMKGSNYVFSASWNWGAAVSSARFGKPEDTQTQHRTAKQALCALLKSFNVAASPDRDCVTSYTRSLEEFDSKGNRPNAETRALFRTNLSELNRSWQEHTEVSAP